LWPCNGGPNERAGPVEPCCDTVRQTTTKYANLECPSSWQHATQRWPVSKHISSVDAASIPAALFLLGCNSTDMAHESQHIIEFVPKKRLNDSTIRTSTQNYFCIAMFLEGARIISRVHRFHLLCIFSLPIGCQATKPSQASSCSEPRRNNT
jgi:hypothetical protein